MVVVSSQVQGRRAALRVTSCVRAVFSIPEETGLRTKQTEILTGDVADCLLSQTVFQYLNQLLSVLLIAFLLPHSSLSLRMAWLFLLSPSCGVETALNLKCLR